MQYEVKVSIRFVDCGFDIPSYSRDVKYNLHCSFTFVFENLGKRPIAIIGLSLVRDLNNHIQEPLPLACSISPIIINPGTMETITKTLYPFNIPAFNLNDNYYINLELKRIANQWKDEEVISLKKTINIILANEDVIETDFNQFYL